MLRGIYGADCLLTRFTLGTFRPTVVWWTDLRWAGAAVVTVATAGLLSPLFLS